MSKVKGKRMDAARISNQKWELQYVADKFDVTVSQVKEAKKACGTSRRKVYKYIRWEIFFPRVKK